MRKLVYVLAGLGVVSGIYFLIPRKSGGTVSYAFRFQPNRSADYYKAAETALDAWLLEKGFTRLPEAPRTPPKQGADSMPTTEAFLDDWLRENGFPRTGVSVYEAPGTPPFRVVLRKAEKDLTCAFDWSYQDYGRFESPDHPRARALAKMLQAWQEDYSLKNP